MSASYGAQVGDRLRNIRLQKGLSLHDVEQASGKEFKASVVGAYERGERSISVPRLARLARFYGVPVDHLLPNFGDEPGETVASTLPQKIRINLQRLAQVNSQELDVLGRYLNVIQMRRGDFNGKVLTIRQDDLQAIASVLELTPEMLFAKIEGHGVKAEIPA